MSAAMHLGNLLILKAILPSFDLVLHVSDDGDVSGVDLPLICTSLQVPVPPT